MMKFLTTVIATGCYAGYSPIGPGTAGSLLAVAAVALFWGLAPAGTTSYLGATLMLMPVGIWAAGHAERRFGHDGSQIVIDEVIGIFVTMALLPRTWPSLCLGFAFFRVLDIAKPFPIHRSQRLPGGFGVVIDDVLAAVYANLLVRGALAFIGP